MKNQLLKLQRIEDILLFLTLLFLPTQLGKHFWPDFSYVYSLKIDYLSPTIYFWDLLVIGLLIVWLFRGAQVKKGALTLLLFFLLTQALSLIGASNIGAGLVRLEQYLIAGMLGVYLASQDLKNLLQKISLPLILAIVGESLLAVLQVFLGSTLGLWILGERTFSISTPGIAKFDFYGSQFLRPYATFPHPNVLAGYLLISIVILISLFVIARPRSGEACPPCIARRCRRAIFQVKIVGGGGRFPWSLRFLGMTWFRVAFLLGGLTTFLTMSRTAILTGIGLLILNAKKKWLVILLLIFIITSPILFTRFSSLLNFDNLTLVRREELVENAWQLFSSSPLTGVGINNFIPASAGSLVVGPSRFLQPVHNIVFLILSETGIIGLGGFLVLVGYPLKKMHNVQCTMYNFLPWLIILFLGMFDHYLLTLPQGYRLLFLVWGLNLAMLK